MATEGIISVANGKPTLMTIPQELRLAIFAMLMVSTNPLKLVAGLDLSVLAALSLTSKSIRMEVIQLFFDQNKFSIPSPGVSTTFLRKAPSAFTSRIRLLKIEFPENPDVFGWDEWYALRNIVRMMKLLKSCLIVLHGAESSFRWGALVPSDVVSDLFKRDSIYDYGPPTRHKLFDSLKMSKTCNLQISIANLHGEVKPLREDVMKAAREAHQRVGMDWSRFIEMKQRRGEVW